MYSGLQALLGDAQLVVDYAIRAGKLDGSELPDAIEALSTSQSISGQGIADFQRALNAAVTAMAPMTLVDLRAGRSPFDARNISSRKRWQVGLSLATVGLITGIAFYQYRVQQSGDALIAYHATQEAQLSEKITAARQAAQFRKALDENSCSFNDYQRARHELRKLDQRAFDAQTRLYQLAATSAWPLGDQFDALLGQVDIWSTAKAGSPAGTGTAEPSGANAPQAAAAAGSTEPDSSDPLCDAARRNKLRTDKPDWLQQVVADSLDDYCFAEKLSLPYARQQQLARSEERQTTREGPVHTLEQRVRIQTAWLLPFLYGLLGACVYVMRRLLFDTRHAAVENLVILLRLALGALSGVVIGWFSAPALAPTLATGGAASWPYVLAFLAGFSIDNLFNVLDRMNRVLSGKDKPAGAASS